MDAWVKVAIALVPLGLGALVAVAWSNSQSMALLTQEYRDIQAEQQHQRALLEQRLGKCP